MIEKTAQRGRELFSSGYYCAESVLLAIAEAKGIQSELIPKIATGLCSGVAQTCNICGAVSGAILGLSLFTGRSQPGTPVEENYALVRELLDKFEGEFGSSNCQGLLGVDLGTDEGQQTFAANNQMGQCLQYTEEATRIAMTLLEEVT